MDTYPSPQGFSETRLPHRPTWRPVRTGTQPGVQAVHVVARIGAGFEALRGCGQHGVTSPGRVIVAAFSVAPSSGSVRAWPDREPRNG